MGREFSTKKEMQSHGSVSSYLEMDRENLEQLALKVISAFHYYDLCDKASELRTDDLIDIVDGNI